MRILAIDYGQRRVGLAISDEGGKLATPLEVVKVSSPDHAGRAVEAVVKREQPQQLLIGLPLNMDGTIGLGAKKAVQWARALATKLRLPAVFVDERLSSFDAEQKITALKKAGAKITRKGKKQRLDALAAAGFLQEYLDGKSAVEVE